MSACSVPIRWIFTLIYVITVAKENRQSISIVFAIKLCIDYKSMPIFWSTSYVWCGGSWTMMNLKFLFLFFFPFCIFNAEIDYHASIAVAAAATVAAQNHKLRISYSKCSDCLAATENFLMEISECSYVKCDFTLFWTIHKSNEQTEYVERK